MDEYDFDGATYEPERDKVRLNKELREVWQVMRDQQWRTLQQISDLTGHPVQAVSARLRDFRKKRFGSHVMEKEYLWDGLWQYRVIPNPAVEITGDGEEDAVDA